MGHSTIKSIASKINKKPCAQGRELLQTQLSILEEPQIDPFQASASNIEDAYKPDQLIDPDEERDEDKDVDREKQFTEKNNFFSKPSVLNKRCIKK